MNREPAHSSVTKNNNDAIFVFIKKTNFRFEKKEVFFKALVFSIVPNSQWAITAFYGLNGFESVLMVTMNNIASGLMVGLQDNEENSIFSPTVYW